MKKRMLKIILGLFLICNILPVYAEEPMENLLEELPENMIDSEQNEKDNEQIQEKVIPEENIENNDIISKESTSNNECQNDEKEKQKNDKINSDNEHIEDMYQIADSEGQENASIANDFQWNGNIIVKYQGKGGIVTIPNNCSEIGNGAFYGNSTITKVIIPSTVKKIDEMAFDECSRLAEIVLSDGLEVIEGYAFAMTSIKSVKLPDTVSELGARAFYYSKLNSATIGSKLQTIGISAFEGCTSLSDITIGNSVFMVGYKAFAGCSALCSITWGNNILVIGNNAFENCVNLEYVELPDTVKEIGDYAFQSCYKLSKLNIPYGTYDIGIGILKNTPNAKIYVYSGSTGANWVKENNCNYVEIGTYKPTPVQSLKAQSFGKSKVRLSWKESAGAKGYLVYAQKNGSYGYCGMTSKGTIFTDTKALDNDYNFYWVFPYSTDANGKMIPGGCVKYVYAKGIIPAVTNLKAASVNGGVKLIWNKSTDAEGYLIYGQVSGKKYDYVGLTKETSFIDRKASKTIYNFYWVFPYHKNTSGKMIAGGTPKYVYGKAK